VRHLSVTVSSHIRRLDPCLTAATAADRAGSCRFTQTYRNNQDLSMRKLAEAE